MTDNHQQQEGLMLLERASDDRARRAARRVGLIARKSRCRVGSIDNFGGFAQMTGGSAPVSNAS
jgi:hypothetical protein